MNPSNERSATALAGARTVISNALLCDVTEPGAAQDVAHVLVVAEAERSHRALARSRESRRRDEGAQGGARVPRVLLHALPAGEDEATARTEPGTDGAEGRQRLVEEHHPQLADGQIEGLRAEAPGLHVADDERRRSPAPARCARSRASSTSGAEMSIPTTRPADPTAPPGRWPALLPRSRCRRPVCPNARRHRPPAAGSGVRASVSRSLLGHAATQRSSFQRFDSLSLATATT